MDGLTPMARASKEAYPWKFKARSRRHAFGWRGSRPAIERIDEAPAEIERQTRHAWLERLRAAREAEATPYIESLADYRGELCGSKELASEWGDRLVGITRMAHEQE